MVIVFAERIMENNNLVEEISTSLNHQIPFKKSKADSTDDIGQCKQNIITSGSPSDNGNQLEFPNIENPTLDNDAELLGETQDSDNDNQERAFQDFYIDGFYYCDKCPSKIRRKDNFKRHCLQVHKLSLVDKSITENAKNKCIYPGCDKAFYHKSRMMQHLQDEHQITVESETKTFDSVEAFYDWKEIEESTNFVYFPRKESRSTSKGLRHETYVCQYKGKKQPAAFKNSSGKRKTQQKKCPVCPARMLVTIKNSKKKTEVSLKYIKSHNHPICCEDIKNKPMSSKVKDEIKEKLLENKSIDDVMIELQQEAVDEPSGSSVQKIYMEKHRIRYIQQKMKLPKSNKERQSAMTIEDRLKSLTTDDFNPILLYKPTPFETDELLSQDETFIFAIQTKEQNQLFQKYANGIVLLELATPSTLIPYYILTIKVVDEVKQAYNVAHLISSIKDDEVITSFFTSIKSRCAGVPLNISLVMTTLDMYGVEQFQNVFGTDIQFIYSKWHFHKLIFSKLLADCPEEEELRHQVYFTLVALIEQRDPENFKVIASDFFHSYKSKCLSIVTFMADLYLSQPEKWALCYRKPEYHHCDIFMHINTTIQSLRFSFGSLKEQLSIGTLLHTLLNNDHMTYLKQRCQQQLAELEPSSHIVSLEILDDDLNKVSDTQWYVSHNESVYEVHWNSDGCLEEFCSIRCLELLCFGLCEHMYTCNCGSEAFDICPHIHKVHSFEMGVSHCQQTPGSPPEISNLSKDKFQLYTRTSTNKLEKVHLIEKNLKFLQEFVTDDPSPEVLEEINKTLDHLKTICQNSKQKE